MKDEPIIEVEHEVEVERTPTKLFYILWTILFLEFAFVLYMESEQIEPPKKVNKETQRTK